MKKKTYIVYFSFCVVFWAVLCLFAAHAQEKYPTRPVEIICPFPPGGAVDLNMRALTSVAEQYLGQPLIPVTRSGGGGTVGTAFVASSKPDGYTILIASSTTILAKPLLEKLPYTADDFVPIGRVAAPVEIIYVLNSSPWKTLKEFVEDAKKNPGKFRYAHSGGDYSSERVIFTSLSNESGIKLTGIPAGGAGAQLPLVLGGHVETSIAVPPTLKAHMAAGTIRPLAVNGRERCKFEEFKEVPTLKELGFGVEHYFWVAVFVPKKTPQPIVQKLRTTLKLIAEDKDYERVMTNMYEEIKYMNGEDFEKYFKEQQLNLSNLLKFMK